MESDSDSGDSEDGFGDSGARKDNNDDFNFGESYDSAGGAAVDDGGGRGGGGGGAGGKTNKLVEDKPYDEAIELGSDDEVVSTPESSEAGDKRPPQVKAAKGKAGEDSDSDSGRGAAAGGGQASGGPSPKAKAGAGGSPKKDAASSDSSSSDSSDGSDDEADGEGSKVGGAAGAAGAYNPKDYANLRVAPEVEELFQYISRYTPHTIELDTKLKPLIPDLIPAIGEVDAFLKIPQPDGKNSDLGLAQLDEPCLNPSDPSVLDLRLRALSKHVDMEPMEVRSIEDPDKNPKEVKSWVDRIADLHRAKPAASVCYSRRMPDIEQLMQVWPAEFEEYITNNPYPNLAELDVDLASYVKMLATILDVPVYDQLTDTLHVIFTLFAEFQSNQHFAPSMEGGGGPWGNQSGWGGDPYAGGGGWNAGPIPPNSRAPSPEGRRP